jgi:hypothetical protein
MAIAISGTIGSATSNASGTTLSTTFTAAQSGNFSIFCLAYDPSGAAVPTVTVTDGVGNTWTSLGAYSAPATTSAGTGVITQIFTSTTAISATTTTVTATFSAAITAKVGRLFTFTGTNGATGIVRNTVRGTASDLTSSLTSVASGDLVLAWGAWEQTGSITATSTTTNGTWVPTNTSVTAVNSGGTGAANIQGYYQYKITTATATQAHTVQNNSSGNCALQYIKVVQLAATTRTATGSGVGSSSATPLKTLVRDSYDNAHSDTIAAASIPASASLYQTYKIVRGGTSSSFYPLYRAQQFTATTSSVIDKVELIIAYPSGTSAGRSISIQIASDDIVNGGNPPDPIPGTVIATSNSILETAIGSNASKNWISFTFPSAISLTAGTKYWIIVQQDSGSSSDVSILHFSNYAYNGWSGQFESFSWVTLDNSTSTSSSVMNFRVIRKNAIISIAAVIFPRNASGSGIGSSAVLSSVVKNLPIFSFSEAINSGYDFYGYNPVPTNNGYWGIYTRIG